MRWQLGINVRVQPEKDEMGNIVFDEATTNHGPGKYLPGGPTCIYNGKTNVSPHTSDDEGDDALDDEGDASDDEGEGENVPDEEQENDDAEYHQFSVIW